MHMKNVTADTFDENYLPHRSVGLSVKLKIYFEKLDMNNIRSLILSIYFKPHLFNR